MLNRITFTGRACIRMGSVNVSVLPVPHHMCHSARSPCASFTSASRWCGRHSASQSQRGTFMALQTALARTQSFRQSHCCVCGGGTSSSNYHGPQFTAPSSVSPSTSIHSQTPIFATRRTSTNGAAADDEDEEREDDDDEFA